jgi:hypothetical protein
MPAGNLPYQETAVYNPFKSCLAQWQIARKKMGALGGPEWKQERETVWRVNRESARGRLGFDLMMEMRPDVSGPEVITAVQDCMFRLAATFAARLQHDAARFDQIIRVVESPRSLFWYLPEEVRVGIPARTQGMADLENALGKEPLAGKSLEVGEALDAVIIGRQFGAPEGTFEIELFTLTVDSLSFEEGSLFAWIRGHMQGLVLATSMVAAISPIVAVPLEHEVTYIVQEYQFHQHVERALDGQPMVKYRGFRYDESQLGYYAGNAFNYEEPGISDDERRYRIALVQLALKVELGTDLVIDGEFGSDTHRHLVEFGKKHHHPPSVMNPFTQADLLRALRPPQI